MKEIKLGTLNFSVAVARKKVTVSVFSKETTRNFELETVAIL